MCIARHQQTIAEHLQVEVDLQVEVYHVLSPRIARTPCENSLAVMLVYETWSVVLQQCRPNGK